MTIDNPSNPTDRPHDRPKHKGSYIEPIEDKRLALEDEDNLKRTGRPRGEHRPAQHTDRAGLDPDASRPTAHRGERQERAARQAELLAARAETRNSPHQALEQQAPNERVNGGGVADDTPAGERRVADSVPPTDARPPVAAVPSDEAGGPAAADRPHKLSSTDLGQALELAARTRTPDGRVGDSAANLVDALPRIETTDGNPQARLTRFVSDALGRDVTMELIAKGPGQGQSGADVYHLFPTDEKGVSEAVAIAKVFPTTIEGEKRLDEFVRELSALEKLRSSGFRSFRVPEPRAVGIIEQPNQEGSVDQRGVLVSTVAPGEPVQKLIEKVGQSSGEERATHLDHLSTAIKDTANAFAEMHTEPEGVGRAAASSYLDPGRDLIRQRVDDITGNRFVYEALSQLPVDKLAPQADEVNRASRQNPGAAATVHGDAHPGNVFWHPPDNRVSDGESSDPTGEGERHPAPRITIIDMPTVHHSLGTHGEPIGSPEHDVSNFTESIDRHGSSDGLTPKEIEDLQRDFIASYENSGGPPLDPDKMRVTHVRKALDDITETGKEIQKILDGIDSKSDEFLANVPERLDRAASSLDQAKQRWERSVL